MPHIASRPEHPRDGQAEHRVEHELPAQLVERGAEQDGPEEHEGDAVEHVADVLAELVDVAGIPLERHPERHARDERGDEARAAERARRPVGERCARAGDDLPPRGVDQLAAAGVDDDRRDQSPPMTPPTTP